MQDNVLFKGHFTVQTINKFGDITDEYVDNNMIMEAARTSMANIFAQVAAAPSVSKLVIGTFGHSFDTSIDENIIYPKSSTHGFVKERDRLFSEYIAYDDTAINIEIKENDLIKYEGTGNATGTQNSYYIWKAADAVALNIATTDFSDTNTWQDMGTTEPFRYTLEFELPGVTSAGLNNLKEFGLINFDEWDAATNYLQDDYVIHNGVYYISTTSSGNLNIEPGVEPTWENYWSLVDFFDSGSTGTVDVSGSSVTFTFDINSTAGNNGSNVVYTEAALYTGNDIFAMKTFKAKVKDDSVLLRIIWTITF